MTSVLFVCTGNVFRSMIAEKCFRDYVKRNGIKGFSVDSAGTAPIPQDPLEAVIERLAFYKIKVKHKCKKVDKKLISKSDMVIAMNFNHQRFLKENFGIDAPLFNELAFGKNEGVLDFNEVRPPLDPQDSNQEKAVADYVCSTVDYIHDSIPSLWRNILKKSSS